ncbi:MAG: hypothetical protein ACKVWR_21845 [Acidimicrobiales bacterium]
MTACPLGFGEFVSLSCVARDGRVAVGAVGLCLGCLGEPAELLRELVNAPAPTAETDAAGRGLYEDAA